VTLAIKSVVQPFAPAPKILELMDKFREMVNHCIKIGLENDAAALKRLSNLSYSRLAEYDVISYYKLHAISQAAGILANRKQSLKRSRKTKIPYFGKGILISRYRFKIVDGVLKVPLGKRSYFDITLNRHTKEILSNPALTVRSFTLTAANTVSICYSQEKSVIECDRAVGVDKNLRNLTVGNRERLTHYDLSKAVDIVVNTSSIISSFKRNDFRIRKKIASKYGQRRRNRVSQLLHCVSKKIVAEAKKEKSAVAFEKLTHIRRLYHRGNYQGRDYRLKLNSWSFAEIKRQITYKAQWESVPVIELSAHETRSTSQLCPQCGKRLQEAHYKDDFHKRQSYCATCQKWMDRDVVAAMNIARKGAEVFQRPKGLAGEAMKGNPTTPVILRVDASKLAYRLMR
jgi:putative transposase